jgi:hypothetical protein
MAGLFAQFNLTSRPGFFLSDGCAIRGVAAGSDIFDPDGDDITPSKQTHPGT